jgi:hypothetical protein
MSYGAQAYARTSQTTATPREIEAQALLKAARQLREIQANWTGPDQNLYKALMFNRRFVVHLFCGRGIKRESKFAGSSPRDRQYRYVRFCTNLRHADGAGSSEANAPD